MRDVEQELDLLVIHGKVGFEKKLIEVMVSVLFAVLVHEQQQRRAGQRRAVLIAKPRPITQYLYMHINSNSHCTDRKCVQMFFCFVLFFLSSYEIKQKATKY